MKLKDLSKKVNFFFRAIKYKIFINFLKIYEDNLFDLNKISNLDNPLTSLMNKYYSDKGNINNTHNYTCFYQSLFSNIKDLRLNIFEIGLGSVDPKVNFHMSYSNKNYQSLASLKAWKDYFSKSEIFGADIDKKVLKNSDRINTFFADMFDEDSIKNMWNKIRAHIQALIDGSEGHIAVFCPSYRLMEEILGEVFFRGVNKVVESRDWTKDDIDKVVAKLKNERNVGNRVLLCGVFGARLSEGIDYDDGVLASVVCIGIPNPPPSVLSNSLKEYISDKFGRQNSWRYTVTQPAINAILQAMGRPIRSIEDRALILLLDNRNDNRTYRECYPTAMKMNTSNDANSTKAFASRFFRRVKRL